MAEQGTAEKRYMELQSSRDAFLLNARDCSKLTIPSLIPYNRNDTRKLPTPYQSVGSKGVNNLASKLLLAILPANSPFFRMMVEPFTLKKMSADPSLKTKIEKALGDYERAVMSDIESSGDRVQIFEALKHLLVAGNVLLYIGIDGVKVFHLDKYVVKRDPMGNVLEIITQEFISPDALPKRIRGLVKASATVGEQKTVSLYTHVKLVNDKYHVRQEANGVLVPGSEGKFLPDKTPWIPLRYTRIDGEDYGRSFVEEYYGDLQSLEMLSKAIVQGSAAAARILFLVEPNGTTNVRTLNKAKNGDFKSGSMRDISVLQLEKYADFRVTLETIQRIEDRLSSAFMLNSSVQRQAERVTAEEIQYVAGELEDALGGVYSILSQELQLPYVKRRMALMQRKGTLPQLPKGIVKPAIVTGIEALGRGQDLRKLDLFIQGVENVLGPGAAAQYMHVDDYLSRRATAVGIDTEGLIKTKDEIAKDNAQRMQQQMLQQATPEAIKQGGAAIQEAMKNNGNSQ